MKNIDLKSYLKEQKQFYKYRKNCLIDKLENAINEKNINKLKLLNKEITNYTKVIKSIELILQEI